MLDLLQLFDEAQTQQPARSLRTLSAEPGLDPHADFRMKVVQIGILEARRRLAAGETAGLGLVLANLEEDIDLLRRSLEESQPLCEA